MDEWLRDVRAHCAQKAPDLLSLLDRHVPPIRERRVGCEVEDAPQLGFARGTDRRLLFGGQLGRRGQRIPGLQPEDLPGFRFTRGAELLPLLGAQIEAGHAGTAPEPRLARLVDLGELAFAALRNRLHRRLPGLRLGRR